MMVVALSAAGNAVGVRAQKLGPSLELKVPVLPTPVASDGKSMVAFELSVTNVAKTASKIRSVRIADGRDGRTLATYVGDDLNKRIRLLDVSDNLHNSELATGAAALIYVELYFASDRKPRALRVEIEADDTDERSSVARLRVALGTSRVPVLGPPLGEGAWVAVHDPSWERGHRRVFYPFMGDARIPGRYAVDWVGVDDSGRISRGENDNPAQALGYGAPVLAGADAEVADVRNDMAEATSIAGNPRHRLEDGSGNYVVLRLGRSRFAFYEHLRPGSIRVRKGDHVERGQPIGNLGFTGDTTGPHLHLHVADCSSPVRCEGMPFVIRGMTEVGRYTSLSDMGTKRWRYDKARGDLGPEWPGYNVVIRFSKPNRALPLRAVAVNDDARRR